MSTPTTTSAIDNLASAIWNNDVIHDRLCEDADLGTLALIARLDRRSFHVSSKWLWREGGDEGQLEYHLASVTCPVCSCFIARANKPHENDHYTYEYG
jgi:hypothetical protein